MVVNRCSKKKLLLILNNLLKEAKKVFIISSTLFRKLTAVIFNIQSLNFGNSIV